MSVVTIGSVYSVTVHTLLRGCCSKEWSSELIPSLLWRRMSERVRLLVLRIEELTD